jgi:RNA polymerase sigma factor (sigma-70 family)
VSLSSFDLLTEPPARSSLKRWPDADLLALFLKKRDPSSEDAFAELVERYGPLVLRVCRSILADEHEAQDAFQVTFLVLARKSHDLWIRDSLAPWLHGVARRIASDARKSATRRQEFERRIASIGTSVAVIEEPDAAAELTAVIQEEIHRLPEAHRSAVILCDLQGQTHQEAALLLGCPVGTVKSRQSRAREQLRRRLTRRGIAISSLILESLLDEKRTTAAVAPFVVRAMAGTATRFESGLPVRSFAFLSPCAELLARAESTAAAITNPRRISLCKLFLAGSAVAAVALVAGPVLHAWLGERSTSKPFPNGSIAALRWVRTYHSSIAKPVARAAVENIVSRSNR